MATLKGWEFSHDKYQEVAFCEKCQQIADIRDLDEEYERLPKYNFCFMCRDPKTDKTPSDEVGYETWALADNGWCDCGCSVCGYTENVDFPGNLGYKYCPSCGAPWDRKRG